MSKIKAETLTWNQCFALIDHYKPTDSTICSALGVTPEELQTAKQMRSTGLFTPATNIDVERYKNLFPTATTTVHTRPIVESEVSPLVKVAKKRGRKGNKIQKAFLAVPVEPVSAEKFAKDNNVALSVLRQSKRFDKTGLGPVNVRMNRETKVLMIWRGAK